MRDNERGQLFKHPWAARSIENGGLNSTILLNANGPFFNRTSEIMQLDPRGMLLQPGGNRLLVVSSYAGNTPEAQVTILLHELGHLIGRLPEDDDSWDGRSIRNTSEVSRHCPGFGSRRIILAALQNRNEREIRKKLFAWCAGGTIRGRARRLVRWTRWLLCALAALDRNC